MHKNNCCLLGVILITSLATNNCNLYLNMADTSESLWPTVMKKHFFFSPGLGDYPENQPVASPSCTAAAGWAVTRAAGRQEVGKLQHSRSNSAAYRSVWGHFWPLHLPSHYCSKGVYWTCVICSTPTCLCPWYSQIWAPALLCFMSWQVIL